MVLKELKERIGRVEGADDSEVVVRYRDTMGALQTAQLLRVVSETTHEEKDDKRRVILEAGD